MKKLLTTYRESIIPVAEEETIISENPILIDSLIFDYKAENKYFSRFSNNMLTPSDPLTTSGCSLVENYISFENAPKVESSASSRPATIIMGKSTGTQPYWDARYPPISFGGCFFVRENKTGHRIGALFTLSNYNGTYYLSTNNGVLVDYTNNSLLIGTQAKTGAKYLSIPIEYNKWYSLVVTQDDSNNGKVFINNTLVKTGTLGINNVTSFTNPNFLGRGGEFMTSSTVRLVTQAACGIGHLFFYNKYLFSEDDVSLMYNYHKSNWIK